MGQILPTLSTHNLNPPPSLQVVLPYSVNADFILTYISQEGPNNEIRKIGPFVSKIEHERPIMLKLEGRLIHQRNTASIFAYRKIGRGGVNLVAELKKNTTELCQVNLLGRISYS